MEFCAASLHDWADDKEKTGEKYTGHIPNEWLGLMQMAHGLEFIHSNKHVHRDITPHNILISKDGDRLLISDFGLCKKTTETGSFTVSKEGHGKIKWMAPELLIDPPKDGPKRATVHADTYAMGCVFFYFLTKGGNPFWKGKIKTTIANFESE